MWLVGMLDGCLLAVAGHTSPARHEGCFPPGAPPAFKPASGPLPRDFAKLPALCIAPFCVFPFEIGEWFSEIPRFKQEPEGNTFHVNGMLLASLGSIDYIQPDFGFSGSGPSMPDLEETK